MVSRGLARAGQSLYGARRIGDFVVNRNYRPSVAGMGHHRAERAALALAGCGRKGGLDLPPTASRTRRSVQRRPDTETERAAQPGVFNPTYGADAAPAAPKGRKKPFILDPLLDRQLSCTEPPCTISTIATACCTPRR